jgi:hypothetical protein
MDMLRARGSEPSVAVNRLFSSQKPSQEDTPEKDRAAPRTPTGRAARGPADRAEDSPPARGAAEETVRDLRERLTRAEEGLGRQAESEARSLGTVLAEAFRDQTAALREAVKGGTKKLSSTIRINPTIKWPMLSDDRPDSKDVEEFFERFDETCALANDGAGMSDAERLKVLLSCLRGSREKVYRVIHKRCRASGLLQSNPFFFPSLTGYGTSVRQGRETSTKQTNSNQTNTHTEAQNHHRRNRGY